MREQGYARAGLWTNPEHLLGCRTARRRTNEQLWRGENRVGRLDAGTRGRRSRAQHQGQRDRADRPYPDAGAFGRKCCPSDHLDEIRDKVGYTVPGGPADEMAALFATITADQPN